MIQPQVRSTLTEALIPPLGYTFDTGIATTYSLDLGTLMTLPLQLAWLATGEDAEAQQDPIRLLEGLRRVAKRLTVFSDRGRIHIPRLPHALMGLMEEMIYEVEAPHLGAFHPKVWILRFISDEPRKEPCIRLLILSRNLTDDRSWDLNLCMEGKPKGGVHKGNREIASFVQALSKWAAKKLDGPRQQDVDSLAKDLHRCDWDLPGAFEQVTFHVMGTGPKPRPFRIDASDEVVIISPFVSDEAVQAVAASARTAVALVSRSEEIGLLTEETRLAFQRVDVLNDDADPGSEEEFVKDSCRGLHAKAIVLRRGWWTHLFVGSANCTNAAMNAGKNVEVMAELVGRQSKVGSPGDWISDKGLGSLLVPFSPVDPQAILKQRAAEDALERCRQFLIRADLTLECRRDEGGYQLLLLGVAALENIGADVWVWPLTVPSDRQIAVGKTGTNPCDLGVYAAQDITSLTGFRLRLNGIELSFGLELPLINSPADREAGVLALILRNRAGFMRYLSLLLGEGEDLLTLAAGNEGGQGWFGANGSPDDSPPLFELLVKAFSRHPDKLNYVASAVDRLRQAETDSGDVLVPPEFLRMWRTFEEARKLGAPR